MAMDKFTDWEMHLHYSLAYAHADDKDKMNSVAWARDECAKLGDRVRLVVTLWSIDAFGTRALHLEYWSCSSREISGIPSSEF
jgi:hypothetical protein